jgi:O-antigen ligase
MDAAHRSSAAPPVAGRLIAAALLLAVIVFIPGLASPFVVPKESVIALAAAFALLLVIADRQSSVARWPWWWTATLLAPLAAVAAAALRNGTDPIASEGLLRWGTYALFLVTVRLVSGDRDGEWLRQWLAMLGGIEGALVVAQQLAGHVVFDFSALPSAKWRAFGTLGNPNWVGGFLAVTLPLALTGFDAAAPGGARRRRAALIVAATVAGLLLTLSRGAWVAATAGVVLLVLLRPDLPWRRIALASTVGAALAASLAALRFGGEEVRAALGRRGSVDGRVRMWDATASMIAQRPLTGWGPARFPVVYPPFQRDHLRARGEHAVTDLTDHPHNEYLHLAAEAGLPAALALLAVFGVALAEATMRRTGAGAAAALVALAVHGCVDTTLRLPVTMMVFCVLLVSVFNDAAAARALPRRPLSAPLRATLAVLAVLAVMQATRLLVVDRALAGARRALAAGDAAGAQRVAEEALQLEPSHGELWTIVALASQEAGDASGARAAAARARALRPAPELIYMMAELERRSGRPAAAAAELRALSETVPGLLLPRVLLGEALAEDGQVTAARGVLAEVLTMRSKHAGAAEQALHARAADRLRALSAHDG